MTLMEDCDAVRRRSGDPKHRRKATVKFRNKSGDTWAGLEHSLSGCERNLRREGLEDFAVKERRRAKR
jgi:hypothetical protein